MTSLWNYIVEKLSRSMEKKNFPNCKNNCKYYKMHGENRSNYQNDNKYDNQNYYQEDIKISIEKLIKENEKYFIYEIERSTFNCITQDNCHIKILGYSHRVAYEIFEKYGIFMYVSDLSTYTNSPTCVKHELQILIGTYGDEKVTEEIAIYLKDKYPQRFGISVFCKQ
jgi:predicted ATPase